MQFPDNSSESEANSKIMSDIPKRENKLLAFTKNFLIFLLLVIVIIASFWFSFFLGKRILTPAKEPLKPTAEIELKETKPVDLEKVLKEIEEQEEKDETPQIIVPQKKTAITKPAVEKPAPQISGMYYKVIAGTFSTKAAAIDQANKLKASGFETFVKQTKSGYSVQVGAFVNKSNAINLQSALKKKGFESTLIYDN